MSRQQQLTQLAAQVLGAARAQDWQAVQLADRALARELPQLAALGPWSGAELEALERLGTAHAMARGLCREASETLEQQIAQLREGRDGWLAYALQDSASPLEARP
ncbi:hypothetical protein [Pseudorhodoferax sp. Leaf265]|jgi:hypothetical protein|uniref:hypothetical protein n=1 Tax=Pseudorhodoferax sp. Leaf265 TaxID=1736315 RepID=UPI0006F78796|nr:hypothetical protein [Pseudorhodoferax sp. Leaf265]KQP06469.1 hypothetical protein ASF45_10460 [Pseudorhodoferax sp. Leaf265]PZQ03274.1 MAG: hypothetical protein DI583_00550 [Variovorax paradoxus]PZQ17548.1 MAG: hypothetical protein DI587_00550 [Variovorax paradoxus]